jgi:hypothetical protein
MIVRICSDVVAGDTVETYLEELRNNVIPLYSGAVGIVSVSILKRHLVGYGEIATVSAWSSIEEMSEFFHSQLPPSLGSRHTVIRREPLTYELVACT